MEEVLDVYTRPYDPKRPMVCMDETSKQLIGETRLPLPARRGQLQRYDYEYVRHGVSNLFMLFEPLQARRYVKVTDRRTSQDWAQLMRQLVDEHYPEAEVVTLVLDNLNTHTSASLYQTFEPGEARRIARRLEIHHTPKHGLLAEHGGNRTERAQPTMPGPAHSGPDYLGPRSGRVARWTK